MIKKTIIPALIGSTFIAGLMFADSANSAVADFTSCSGTGYDINAKVDPNHGCTILLPLNATGGGNDSVNPPSNTFTVNEKEFFGFNDWLFDGKWEGSTTFSETGDGTVGDDNVDYFNFTGGAQTGLFTYAGPALANGEFMFVFKDGNDTNLVGYLVYADNGTYSSPFVNPPFSASGSGLRDISHISVYYHQVEVCSPGDPRCRENQIPEPITLVLLGVGLAGLGWSRRRQK